MGKIKKSTRKFKDKQLAGAIQKRRKHASVKRQQVVKAVHKANARGAQIAEEKEKKSRRLEDLGVDDFLDGGFEEGDEDSGSDALEDDLDALSSDAEDEQVEKRGKSGSNVDDEAATHGAKDGSASDDAADEEDINDDVAADNRRLKGSVSRHKADLEALAKKDPEFFAYLQQTDAGLLDFGGDDEASSEDAEEEEEEDSEELVEGAATKQSRQKAAIPAAEEEEEEEEVGTGAERKVLVVTSELVGKWSAAAAATVPPLGAVRQLVKAYRLACHYGDGSGDDGEDDGAGSGNMRINSASVYNQLMIYMLKEADGVFRRMLGLDKKKEAAAEDVAKSARWRKVGPLVKSFWGNSLHLLRILTDASLITFALRRLRASVLLLAPFKPLADRLLKTALGLFGAGEQAAPRVQAFLCIRTLALTLPQPAMDRCLKGTYRTYLSNSKFVSAASAPHIAFMATCCVELWGCGDGQAAYEHAFGAVRQLALALRNALNLKTADSYKEVYSWQGVNCLELWGKVLGAHYKTKAELRPLAYPLTQLLLGAARLVPTPRYFPLRLRLVRALNRLSVSTGLFIPVAPVLLEMLRWKDLHQPPKGGAGTVPEMSLQLRVSKQLLRTTGFQEEVLTQVLELLAEHLAQWSCSVAFPELSHLTLLQLRKFIKSCTVERFRRTARQLVDALVANAAWVGRQRDKAEFSPKDAAAVASFLAHEAAEEKAPLQQFTRQLLTRSAERHAMRAASQVTLGGKSSKRKRQDHDDSSSDGEPGNGSGDDGIDEPIGIDAEGMGADGSSGLDINDASADEDQADEASPLPSKKRKKALNKADTTAAGGREETARDSQLPNDDDNCEIQGMDSDEDVLEDYVLSDADTSEDEEGSMPDHAVDDKNSDDDDMDDDDLSEEGEHASGDHNDGEDNDDDNGDGDDDDDDDGSRPDSGRGGKHSGMRGRAGPAGQRDKFSSGGRGGGRSSSHGGLGTDRGHRARGSGRFSSEGGWGRGRLSGQGDRGGRAGGGGRSSLDGGRGGGRGSGRGAWGARGRGGGRFSSEGGRGGGSGSRGRGRGMGPMGRGGGRSGRGRGGGGRGPR